VVCLAPRAAGDIVRPRRLSGLVVRPLNFTVRHRPFCHGGTLMPIPEPTAALSPAAAAPPPFREVLTDAIRYWEPRRIGYNAVLTLIVLGWVVFTWPHFRGAITWRSMLALFVLAVLANVCYCAAYLIDVPVQCSAFRDSWRRRRWLLWLIGVIFAGIMAFYWVADEIYPSVAQVTGGA